MLMAEGLPRMGRLASAPEDHAATGQQRRPWCTNVLAAAAVIADVIGDCADTIHVALPASTSDNGHYVAHGQARRKEIRTWCCVEKGAVTKNGDIPLQILSMRNGRLV
jgi:hypothetical protein